MITFIVNQKERIREIDHVNNEIICLNKKINSLKEKYKKQSFQYSHSQLELQLSQLKINKENIKQKINSCTGQIKTSPIKQNMLKGMKVCLEDKIMKMDYELKVLSFKIKQNKDTKKKNNNQIKYNFNRNKLKKRYYQNLNNDYSQNNVQQNLVQEKNQNIVNQNTQLNRINSTLSQVVSSFQKMTEIIQHQDEIIADIEVNTQNATENMKQGKNILLQIYQDVNANRQLIIKFFLIMFVISFIYLKFL